MPGSLAVSMVMQRALRRTLAWNLAHWRPQRHEWLYLNVALSTWITYCVYKCARGTELLRPVPSILSSGWRVAVSWQVTWISVKHPDSARI